jgi:hypothetical protein
MAAAGHEAINKMTSAIVATTIPRIQLRARIGLLLGSWPVF